MPLVLTWSTLWLRGVGEGGVKKMCEMEALIESLINFSAFFIIIYLFFSFKKEIFYVFESITNT